MKNKDFNRYIDAEILKCKSSKGLLRWLKICGCTYLNPSSRAIWYLRKMQYHAEKKAPFSNLFANRYHMKLVKNFGICVGINAKIGMGIHIPHPTSIVIGDATVIGDNCSIYQNCTVGGARIGDVKIKNQPVIGNNVTLFAGSMVLGSVKVADNVTVGANSVVLNDAEEHGGIYVGSPARLIGVKDAPDERESNISG